MKIASLFASVLALSVTVFVPPASALPAAGKPAPAFSAKLLDGSNFDLAAKRGHVVIVSFWATWCGPCRQEMPALQAYYQRHHAEGLDLVAISMDDPGKDKAVRKIMAAYSFAAAMKGQAKTDGYGQVYRLPMAFIIDRNGVLRFDGTNDAQVFDARKLDAVVTPLLSGR